MAETPTPKPGRGLWSRSAGSSAFWLMLERLLRMLSGIFVAALVARVLGPARFGEMNLALQVLAFATPFAMLGLDSMVMNWLVREREEAGRIVGQTLLARLVTGSVLIGGFLVAGALAGWPDEVLYAAIAVTSLLPHAFLTVQRYFLSRQRGDMVFATSCVSITVAAALRIWLALTAPSVTGFLILYVAEQAIMGAALLVAYLRAPDGPGLALDLSAGERRAALARVRMSLPLLPTILAGTLFATMDFFMLKMFSTPEQLGLYSAAVRVTAAWVALQAAMVDGVAASIVRESDPSDTEAGPGLLRIYESVAALSLVVILVVTLFGERIGWLLYGADYVGVGQVMMIHVWAALFLGWRKVSALWLIADGSLWLTLRRHLPAILVAALLGPFLIPSQGAAGAALAMLAGSFASGFLADFAGKATRKHGLAKLHALRFANLRRNFRWKGL